MDNNRKWLYISLTLSLILVFVSLVVERDTLFLLINNGLQPLGEWFWGFMTNMGDGLAAALFILFFAYKQPRMLRTILLATLISLPIIQGLKYSIRVIRPGWILADQGAVIIGHISRNFSFPSGHTATGAVVFGVMMFMVKRWQTRAILLIFTTIVGISRVAVGVHWPLDVGVGLFIGFLVAYLSVVVDSRWRDPNRYLTLFLTALLTVGAVVYATIYKTNPSIPIFQIVFGWTTSIFGIHALWYYSRELILRR